MKLSMSLMIKKANYDQFGHAAFEGGGGGGGFQGFGGWYSSFSDIFEIFSGFWEGNLQEQVIEEMI